MFIKIIFVKISEISAGILLLAITMLSETSIAATYYISPTGTALWSECTDEGAPCSAQSAMANAMAGDIVYFRGGIYEVTGPHEPYHGVLEPSNSGTSNSNTITFAAYPDELPVINCTIGANDDVCLALGTGGQNYITWDGFKVMANNGVKIGGVMVGQNDSPRSIGNTIQNCILDGGSAVVTSTDNRDLIRMEQTTGTTIRGCILYGANQVNDWPNTAIIKMYFNDYVTIENNEIYDCTVGIYMKADIDNSIVRNNYVHDCARAIHGQVYLTRNSDNNKVYNNVVANNDFNGISVQQNENATADNWEVYNNTIVNSHDGVLGAKGRWKIWNNLIINNTANGIITINGNVLEESDHNFFGSTGFHISTQVYGALAATYNNIGSWQNSTELLGGGSPGVGSVVGDPGFVNSSTNFSELFDFVLAPESLAIGAGRGGENLGAKIDAVGTGKKHPAALADLTVNE